MRQDKELADKSEAGIPTAAVLDLDFDTLGADAEFCSLAVVATSRA